MWIGIDVGGTFTNAVAAARGEVVAAAKAPTDPDRLELSLLGALDGLLQSLDGAGIARVCLSTTLVTNAIAGKQLPPVALLLLPGPGINPQLYRLPARAWRVGGAVDFRGREIAPLDLGEAELALDEIAAAGYTTVAIVGKFSPRFPAHEEALARRAQSRWPDWNIAMGHRVAGQLNFPRRAAATALQAAIGDRYATFLDAMEGALAQRGLTCPIVVLKGDGGTLALAEARRQPLVSIASGPAASAMGALALRPKGATSVVVDIGGSTTDLALILDGQPLFYSKGAELDGIRLPVRAFATRSIALGGDSPLILEDGHVSIGGQRRGVAAGLGGPAPTLTDALRLAGYSRVGDRDRAMAALASLGEPQEVAALAVATALQRLEEAILHMLADWKREPVYRLWELRLKGERRPDDLVGVGGAAAALLPALGQRLQAEVSVPQYAEAANALGAAMARTTFTTTVHADTERGVLQVIEEGHIEPLRSGRVTLEDVRGIARTWMERRGRALGIEIGPGDVVEVLAEQFNIIEEWATMGKQFDVCLERPCGLVDAGEASGPMTSGWEAEQ